MLTLEFELSGITIADVERVLDQLQAELRTPRALRRQAESLGIDPAILSADHRWIGVEPAAHGIDSATAGIIVILGLPFAKAAAKVTEKAWMDVWDKVLFPRVQQRLGPGAISASRKPKERTAASRQKSGRR